MKLWRRKKIVDTREADIALQQSQRALRRIKSRDSDVKNVVSDIVQLHRKNHFAEHIQALISSGGGVSG